MSTATAVATRATTAAVSAATRLSKYNEGLTLRLGVTNRQLGELAHAAITPGRTGNSGTARFTRCAIPRDLRFVIGNNGPEDAAIALHVWPVRTVFTVSTLCPVNSVEWTMLEVDGERRRQNSEIKRCTVCLLLLFLQWSGAPKVLTQKCENIATHDKRCTRLQEVKVPTLRKT